MKKLALALSLALLAGCTARIPPPPMAVQAMPNDCANRKAIINWLADLESKQTDERYRGEIRAKIWTVRYNCQPV